MQITCANKCIFRKKKCCENVLWCIVKPVALLFIMIMYQPYPPTTISPGPPLFPLNPRECGSLDLAPFLTVSCLTAIWRPSFRYWPICALCLSMSSAVSLAVLGGVLLPFAHFFFTQTLAHSCTDFPSCSLPCLHSLAIQESQAEGEKKTTKHAIEHVLEVVWFHKLHTGAGW